MTELRPYCILVANLFVFDFVIYIAITTSVQTAFRLPIPLQKTERNIGLPDEHR